MKQIKAIQTEYKGYLFRSRLEARWAVFFDACGVQWEYEPEGYDLGNGILYLPDFLLHNVAGRAYGDLFVEVKGNMTHNDSKKIKRFIEIGMQNPNEYGKSKTAILLVGNIPEGETMIDIINDIGCKAYDDHHGLSMYNFESIDGDYFAAHPGVNKNGRFELFGDDCNYLCDMDVDKTAKAYRLARQARFEHGETPMKRRFK